MKIKNNFDFRDTPGFTLIEMLVTVSILGLMMTALVGIFLNSMRANARMELRQRVDESGNWAIDQINRKVRASVSVEDFVNVCDGDWVPSLNLMDSEDNVQTLTCSSGQIFFGGEILTPSDLTTACTFDTVDPVDTVGFVRCSSSGQRLVVEVAFGLSALGQAYEKDQDQNFITEVMLRSF